MRLRAIQRGRARQGFALSDGLGHIGGAVGALALPAMVAAFSFQIGFAAIGVTGLLAGVLALAGPATTKGMMLEQISQRMGRFVPASAQGSWNRDSARMVDARCGVNDIISRLGMPECA